MAASTPFPLREALVEKLAESLSGSFPDATPRRLHGSVELPGKATAVVGMRRAGKTTFLHQLRREREAAGTPRNHLPYLNFEDERLAGIGAEHLGFLVGELARRLPVADGRRPVLWCLDEIQVVPGWEKFVRRLLDSGGNDVAITGSSAALLSREIATSLRGRAWEVPIYPFSFAEAVVHSGVATPDDVTFLSARDRGRIERAFLQWLDVGGFPEAQRLDASSRARLLRDYVDVAILRDVVERHGVTNVVALRWMVRHLLGNAAASFSVEKFHGALKSQGVAVSKDTVHHLLAHLEDSFLVRTVWMESSSERQRMVNPRKAYPIDTGLIPLFDRSGKSNLGHALETSVLIELERRRCHVTYVRTDAGFEVDFLARSDDGDAMLIQVCADASDPETAAREMRSLVEAGRRFPKVRRLLLTLTRDGLPAKMPKGITARPAYEWMLEQAGSTRT